MIEVRHVCLSFGPVPALKDVSLDVRAGEHIVIMGPAASGKSTLAKVMDGLLLPDAGDCLVDSISSRDDPLHARRLVGLVFQEPEDQAVARRVEDDIAFGPHNLEADDVRERVAEALRLAGIEGLAGRNIHSLSGGQKQLVAIAGVLAMRPAYLVLDEPTSMLDSAGTRMVSETIAALKKEGRGVVVITQDPAMAVAADRLVVLSAGSIVADGPPREVFSHCPDGLLELPEMARLSVALRKKGVATKRLWLNLHEATEDLCR
ncbi:MAG TPA: ATP-binding cassette domain-containing protein [Methanocella sp.]|jgi:energy-coupling factor transporter ATP-binding protein EcfA2